MTRTELIQRYRIAENIDPEGDSCYSITPRLINGQALSVDQSEMVNNLDSAFEDTTSQDETVLYRGTSNSCLQIIKDDSQGRYPSFVSTSLDIFEAQQFLIEDHPILLKIICPKGVPFMQISSPEISGLEASEILLPRNTRFKISDWNPLEGLSTVDKLRFGQRPESEYATLRVITE